MGRPLPDPGSGARRNVDTRASAEKALIQGFHFPFPSAGYVERYGDRYRLVPIHSDPNL